MYKFLFCIMCNIVNSFNIPHIGSVLSSVNLPSINTIPEEFKIKIIEDTTGLLPKLDWFSHLMLTNNEKFIDSILHSDLDDNFKKQLILKIVEFLREGDEMGGVILLKYYNLIDTLL